jgi:ABC-2 type transport system ATP-binding protein
MVLASVSLAWGAGVHAVLGASEDGGALLLALVAGAVRPRVGRVRVLGAAATDAGVRKQVAFVGLEPSLPEALRVHEVLALAAAIRQEPPRDAAARLAVLGVETLAVRKVRSLSRPEARAVALAEAVTSSRVRVLLANEPLVAVDPRAASRLPAVLRERAGDGCAVVVATGSPRDASELADDHVILRGGALVGRATSIELLAGFSPEGVRLGIVLRDASGARSLASALAQDAQVEGVERRGACVTARGRQVEALARAAGRAIVDSGADVTELRIELPGLEEARSTSTAIAAATFEAAYARTRAALAAKPEPSAPPTHESKA